MPEYADSPVSVEDDGIFSLGRTFVREWNSVKARYNALTPVGAGDEVAGEPLTLRHNDVLTPVDSRFGAAGDGDTDDTTALQSCIDVVTGGGSGVPAATFWLGPHAYKITDTLTMNRQAIRFLGDGVGNTSDYTNSGKGSAIRWDGIAGIPMIQVNDSSWNEFSDFNLIGHDTKTPSEGILFEWNTGESTGTNANQLVRRVHFGHWPWSVPSNAGELDYGIRFGGDSGNNDEFSIEGCKFRECEIAGIAIDNSQSTWGQIMHPMFDQCAIGIKTSASVAIWNARYNRSTGVDLELNGSPQVWEYGHNSEHAVLAVRVNDNGGKLSMWGGTILCQDEMVGDYWGRHENLGNDGMFKVDSLRVEHQSATKKMYARGNTSSGLGSLVVRDAPGVTDLSVHFDVAAAATGAGVEVNVDSYGTVLRELLTGSATMSTAIPEITGSAGGNAALANLLTELGAMGLITDSST